MGQYATNEVGKSDIKKLTSPSANHNW